MYIAEILGLFLVGYGIWFGAEGVKRYVNAAKDWWRPVKGKRRYPYPAAGILLGLFMIAMGLIFVLNNVWQNARTLAYVGGVVFGLVLVAGVGQPRFLHPRWYARLEDRFGKKAVIRLKQEALRVEDEEWSQVVASEASFDEWVGRVGPRQGRRAGRGYRKRANDE